MVLNSDHSNNCVAAAKSLSRVRLCATPWTAAYQAPPFMGFSRQEYWSGVTLYIRCLQNKHLYVSKKNNSKAMKRKLIELGIWATFAIIFGFYIRMGIDL